MNFRVNEDKEANPKLFVSGVILIWLIYVCLYLILKNRPEMLLFSGYLL